MWEPYDPATILSAHVSKLASNALGLDEIADELAREKMDSGVALAREAGIDVRGRVASGKSWRAICDVANELDAEPIVLGARGLSRVQSVLLGSVSAAVSVHAGRPVLIVPREDGGRGMVSSFEASYLCEFSDQADAAFMVGGDSGRVAARGSE